MFLSDFHLTFANIDTFINKSKIGIKTFFCDTIVLNKNKM